MKIDAKAIKSYLTRWESLLAITTILFIALAAATTPGLLSGASLTNAFQVVAEKALFVLPLLLLIIGREIDISVASIGAFAAVTVGLLTQGGAPFALAAVIGLVVGGLCGALNGFCVAVLGMPSLVVTLGSLALFRGLCYVLLGSTPITSSIPPELITWSYGTFLGWVPNNLIPLLILIPIFAIALHRRPIGRQIYAIGGGPDVARYSGVKVLRLRFWLFVVSGTVAAIAGIIAIGRTSQVTPDSMVGYELDAITVVFLGGVSFLGGAGRMTGVLWSLLLIVMLRQTLLLQGQGQYAQGLAVGLLLIGSLLLANVSQRVGAWLNDRRLRAAAQAA